MKRPGLLLLLLASLATLIWIVPPLWRDLRVRRALYALESSSEADVREARRALAREGRRAVLPLLDLLLRPDPRMRARAAEVLETYSFEELEEALRPRLSSGEVEERTAAARALGLLEREEAAGLLQETLADPDPEVVRAAVVSLAHLRAWQSAGELRRLLVQGAATVRGACAHALGEWGDESVRADLTRARDHDPSEYVRQEAEKALRLLDSGDGREAVPD